MVYIESYFLQKDDEDDMTPLFEGMILSKSCKHIMIWKKRVDDLYDIVGGKIAALLVLVLQFWRSSTADFEKLDNDIEEGNI